MFWATLKYSSVAILKNILKRKKLDNLSSTVFWFSLYITKSTIKTMIFLAFLFLNVRKGFERYVWKIRIWNLYFLILKNDVKEGFSILWKNKFLSITLNLNLTIKGAYVNILNSTIKCAYVNRLNSTIKCAYVNRLNLQRKFTQENAFKYNFKHLSNLSTPSPLPPLIFTRQQQNSWDNENGDKRFHGNLKL